MKLVFLIVSCILLLYAGCMNMATHSYKKPASSDFETLKCMTIGKQNLNAHQLQAIKEAASDVCDIFAAMEFKEQISLKTWLASCEKKYGKRDSISGKEIYGLLARGTQRFSVYAHRLHDAEGETDNDEDNPDNNMITIDPDLIEGWYSPNDSVKAKLINVLAHEYVHLLSNRFLDYDDHAPKGCDEDLLVSYRIGDLAEEIWLKNHKKYSYGSFLSLHKQQ